jgi:tetratricopeptide (TPR) repeat protein
MPKPPRGRPAPARPTLALDRWLVDELRRTAKPAHQADAVARLGRAVELLERGDSRGAVREAEKAKAHAGRSAAVREVLGIALYHQGRWREALAELKAYKRLTGRADQNHLIADCLRALGRSSESVPLAEEALRSRVPDEAKAEAVIVAAASLADAGRFAEALAFLRRARTRGDVSSGWILRLWYVTADILERAGRRDEAAAEFRKILRHDPAAFDVAERLAQLG